VGRLEPSSCSARVLIVYRWVPKYRLEMYEQLRRELAASGVHLDVAYGAPSGVYAGRSDAAELGWGIRMRNQRIGLVRGVEQASRLLLNYVLHALRAAGVMRLAYWGHGRNLQERTASRFGEAVKRALVRQVDWWFAYTDVTRAVLKEAGMPEDRVTVVNNSMAMAACAAITDAERESARERLGLRGKRVVAFCGALYEDKRLGFLLEAGDRIAESCQDFVLIAIGDGPEKALLERHAETREWLRVEGALFGEEKCERLRAAELLLIPGAVGLAILDGMSFGLPLVTTDVSSHGPEIAYLNSANGQILPTSATPAEYAVAVLALMDDRVERGRLSHGALRTAQTYTLDDMVHRFATGILAVLQCM
jgi:glycosyltransferase involved in cell wall biosynthesis